MTIFKKLSPLEGNAIKSDGTLIEFKGMFYETEDADEIALLSKMKCYVQVAENPVEEKPKQPIKSATGTISAADLAKMSAQNK